MRRWQGKLKIKEDTLKKHEKLRGPDSSKITTIRQT